MNRYLDARTASLPEIRDFIKRYPVAIVPLGSTEQHAAHLPLDTDNLIATQIAHAVGMHSVGVVMPTSNVGYAWVWNGVEGTMSLRFDTYMRYIRDIAESLQSWGVKAVYFISGHGSNPQPIKHAVRELITGKIDIEVFYGLYCGVNQMINESDSESWHGDFHADEIETSMILQIAPHLVKMDKAVADYPEKPFDYGYSSVSMRDLINTGSFGDPTNATREKGERWLNYAAVESSKQWVRFLEKNKIIAPDAIVV